MSLLCRTARSGLLTRRRPFHTVGTITPSPGTAAFYKFAVAESRKKAFAELDRNYDSMDEFEKRRKAGIFQSAK